MDRTTFIKSLETRMKSSEMNRRELSLKAGLNETAVRDIIEKQKNMPRLDTVWSLARALNCSLEDLAYGENKKERILQAPLISFVQAGAFTECMDPYEKGDFETLVNTSHSKPTVLALKVKGESMNLIAPNGSTIIVDYCDKELVDGKFYVVRINGDDETTFKQYRANPTRFEAYSNIQGFETIFPREGMEVIGLVVEVLNRLYEK